MSCSDVSRRGVLGLLALLPAACGFQPLYGEGAPAARMSGRVDVGLIEGEAGFAMRERLTNRLGEPADAPYHLEVKLTLTSAGTALTQENVTTRFDVTGVAEYTLTPVAGGPAVASGVVRSVTGFNAPDFVASTAFAARAAEIDAERRLAVTLADEIVQRLALSAGGWA
ncbi:MAG: LPS assembly lipoprotein LptE [Amaricoccus sp.]|uniref:LPS assembly lipoprotein LptE n=1 Tax=Amaricoccus sp. TaxID=1872485 RepID=UPI0039E58301